MDVNGRPWQEKVNKKGNLGKTEKLQNICLGAEGAGTYGSICLSSTLCVFSFTYHISMHSRRNPALHPPPRTHLGVDHGLVLPGHLHTRSAYFSSAESLRTFLLQEAFLNNSANLGGKWNTIKISNV